jgi:hypothetical protein
MTFVIGVAVLWGGNSAAQGSHDLVVNGGGRLVGEKYVILNSALGQPAIGSFGGSLQHRAGIGYGLELSLPSIAFATPSLPLRTCLGQNHPNPFNPETYIRYSLRKPGSVGLRVYDVDGRLIKGLVEEDLPAGEYTVRWDGTDEGGSPVASGIYFCRLEAGDSRDVRKMVLLK